MTDASQKALKPMMVALGIADVAAALEAIDWAVIVFDVKAALELENNAEVARMLNLPKTTVQSWIDRGTAPVYANGAMLLELHARACGAEKTQMRLREFRERATRSAS